MVSVRNLSFSYGATPIFDEVSFSVPPAYKVGIVGPNGAGKTTLLNLIADVETPNSGIVEKSGTVGYVPQEVKNDPVLDSSSSIREYLDPDNKNQDFELRIILDGLELKDIDFESSPTELSGGQKTRLALARALLAKPDVLLLDEPTNFMDVEGKKWVMNFLAHYPHTLILISHDINLLDKSIDKVVAINTHTKKVDEYKGNYSKYLKLKEEKEELTRRHAVAEEKHIKRMEKSLVTLMGYKSKKGVRQRVMLQKRIERLKEALPELPREVRSIKIQLKDPAPVGQIPIKATDIFKSYEDQSVLEGVSLVIERGEKVALVGKNGAGKSTFIKILMGLLEPDSGEIVRDDNLKVGYYSQELENIDMEKTLVEVAREESGQPDYFVRPLLAKFLFPGDKVFQRISSLSGGEKTRLSILLLVLHDYNLLILDEPTTYLDVMSQRVILESLKEYKGAMLLVSHTEEFVNEIRPNRVLLLPDNQIKHWSPELLEKVSEI